MKKRKKKKKKTIIKDHKETEKECIYTYLGNQENGPAFVYIVCFVYNFHKDLINVIVNNFPKKSPLRIYLYVFTKCLVLVRIHHAIPFFYTTREIHYSFFLGQKEQIRPTKTINPSSCDGTIKLNIFSYIFAI